MKRKNGITVLRRTSMLLPCGLRMRYFLLLSEGEYGICLEKFKAERTESEEGERVLLRDVASDYRTSEKIYRMLASGAVTPMCVYEVMEEYFAQKAYA